MRPIRRPALADRTKEAIADAMRASRAGEARRHLYTTRSDPPRDGECSADRVPSLAAPHEAILRLKARLSGCLPVPVS